MDLRGCIPLISSDQAKFPFLSLFYNLQIFYLHAYPIYLPAAASFPRVNKFAIVQAIQVIASLCSSDALLTSDPLLFVLSHLIENCMYLAIDMHLYQILISICILTGLACRLAEARRQQLPPTVAASGVGGVRHHPKRGHTARPNLLTECCHEGHGQSQGYHQGAAASS